MADWWRVRNLRRFLTREEAGAALVEYGLLLALIAVGALLGVSQMGQGLSKTFRGVSSALNTIPNRPY